MDEEKNKLDWDEYYQKLDPMGKQFIDLIHNLNEINKALIGYVLERGQLYGAMLHFMEQQGVDSFELSLEDLKSSRKDMLFFLPRDDGTGVVVIKRQHEYSDLQEPIEDASGDSTV